MRQKSYDGSATLYLIPTPIGNMEDITFRAVNILKEAELVLCEDTRVTGILLKHLEIKKRLVANHEHNEARNKELVLSLLEEGKTIALVSDRGTPVISDPGFEIAKYVIEQGYNVVGLPGATALIPALIMSGINPMPFTFFGFLNSKESKRKKELENLKEINTTIIIYEAPHRIHDTIKNIYEILGDRKISISREISKRYEEVIRGTASQLIDNLNDIKGEMVVVIEGSQEKNVDFDISITGHVNLYISDGLKTMDAVKKVAKERNLPKGKVYEEYHK